MKSRDEYEVSSFVGLEAKGNQHVVLVGHLDFQECILQSRKVYPKILVVIDAPSHPRPNVRFFQSGRSILRCGSGSLAIAYVLHRYYGIEGESEVLSRAGRIVVGSIAGEYYFRCTVFPLRKEIYPLSWSSIINKPVVSVNAIGPRNGYYLLELPDEKSVKHCCINEPILNRVSRRAVIVTAKSDRATDDYVMRYFSPQYSQQEDPATGSANAMLAEYWQIKLRKKKIVGRQLSQAQGRFCVIKKGLGQCVTGKVMPG